MSIIKIKNANRRKKNAGDNDIKQYEGMLLSNDTPFGVTEAFNKLRTNMIYTSLGKESPLIGVTSPYAHAGKSVIISNLAISYTQLDKKVLLIDGDMRCPVIAKLFNLKKGSGLSEILVSNDKTKNYKSFINTCAYKNLDIITSGKIPPNPSALLASENFEKFIEAARPDYDYIFIDLPPICEVTDAGVIANIVDGYVFTIRSGVTDKRALDDADEKMKNVKANILGFVVNDIPLKYLGIGGNYKYGKYGKYGKYSKYSRYGYGRYGRYASYSNAAQKSREEDSKTDK